MRIPEFCCDKQSNLGRVCQGEFRDKIHIVRCAEGETDVSRLSNIEFLCQYIDVCSRYGVPTSVHAAIPCTPWSAWQSINLNNARKRGDPTLFRKLESDREESFTLQSHFYVVAKRCIESSGFASYEWPDNCLGWECEHLRSIFRSLDMCSVRVDGCHLKSLGSSLKTSSC